MGVVGYAYVLSSRGIDLLVIKRHISSKAFSIKFNYELMKLRYILQPVVAEEEPVSVVTIEEESQPLLSDHEESKCEEIEEVEALHVKNVSLL
jgi:hypothetical protein